MNKTHNTLISTHGYPERVPFFDSSSSQLAVGTWPTGDLGDISQIWMTPSVEIETFSQGTPIPGTNLELRYALVVEKRITRDGVVILSGALDEEAFGLTEREAYFDFLTSLRDHYESLKGRGPSLSAHDSSVLEMLRNLLTSTQS